MFYLFCSENESLWREVAQLSQKHTKQQQIVNKVSIKKKNTIASSRAVILRVRGRERERGRQRGRERECV